jgi:hypothetical protein
MFTFLAFIALLLIFSDSNRIDLINIFNAAALAFALTYIAQAAF